MAKKTKKVLIIDDEPNLTYVVSRALAADGYECTASNDPEKGIELFYDLKPDLCIIDLIMPRIDGFKICKEIKSSGDREAAVIIVSAVVKAPSNRMQIRRDSQADLFLGKPFTLEQLREAVAEVMA